MAVLARSSGERTGWRRNQEKTAHDVYPPWASAEGGEMVGLSEGKDDEANPPS